MSIKVLIKVLRFSITHLKPNLGQIPQSDAPGHLPLRSQKPPLKCHLRQKAA